MTCRELVELVTEYFDGALDEDDRARLEAHLAACRDCERYVEQMRVTLRLLDAASGPAGRPRSSAARIAASVIRAGAVTHPGRSAD